jgi:hypothetical protein
MPSLTINLWLQDAVEAAVRKHVEATVRAKYRVPPKGEVSVEVKAGPYEVTVEWDIWEGEQGSEIFTPADALRIFLGQPQGPA